MRRALKNLLRCLPAALVLMAVSCQHQQAVEPALTIHNPYAEVDWAADGRYRANFHTHTTGSDGALNPHEAVDRYHGLGYQVLAFTDHDVVTWPWTEFATLPPHPSAARRLEQNQLETDTLVRENRDPEALGMVAIPGNELSRHHHLGSLFSLHEGTHTEEESLVAIGEKGGLAMLYHPGRYDKALSWYIDLYERHPHLIGIEVYNQGDRYKTDRALWDSILTELMPDRPVWGHSNDDMHRISHLGRNYSVMLLPELTEAWVRRGLVEGRSYFVYSPVVDSRLASPIIRAIHVDHQRGRISIDAEGEREAVWISEGQIIHRGRTLDLAERGELRGYVRAELFGDHDVVVSTQPFGISRALVATLEIDVEPGSVSYVDDRHVVGHLLLRNVVAHPLQAALDVQLEGRHLLAREVTVESHGIVRVPVSLPITALNREQQLSVTIDLGADYGRLRRFTVPLPLAVAPRFALAE